ncbi:MAG: hypothetical protein ACYDCK_11820 [Thermoplasmatota archaeon]
MADDLRVAMGVAVEAIYICPRHMRIRRIAVSGEDATRDADATLRAKSA